MARVPYLKVSDLAPEHQDLLKRPITLHQALVNSPNAARAFNGLGHFIRYGSKLDPRLRELAILQVGWLARSPYEWSHHVKPRPRLRRQRERHPCPYRRHGRQADATRHQDEDGFARRPLDDARWRNLGHHVRRTATVAGQ